MAQTRIGIFGKHPAFGDFLGAGLSGPLRELLETWLNAMLPELRALWAEAWEPNWDAAPVLRFWIGGDVLNMPVAGVMVASRDRVGRRFPLIALAEDAGLPPPVLDADQGFYDALLGRLATVAPSPDAGAQGLAEALALDGAATPQRPETDFWAARGDADLGQLWADIRAADHRAAAEARSYWWRSGGDVALYVAQGLPPAGAFGWLWMDPGGGAAPDPAPDAESDEELP